MTLPLGFLIFFQISTLFSPILTSGLTLNNLPVSDAEKASLAQFIQKTVNEMQKPQIKEIITQTIGEVLKRHQADKTGGVNGGKYQVLYVHTNPSSTSPPPPLYYPHSVGYIPSLNSIAHPSSPAPPPPPPPSIHLTPAPVHTTMPIVYDYNSSPPTYAASLSIQHDLHQPQPYQQPSSQTHLVYVRGQPYYLPPS